MPYRKFKSQGFGEKPVKEGQSYDVIVEGIGSKGDGIGKIQGFVLVIPGVKKGDNVKVKVTAVRGKVAFAEVVGQGEAKPESKEESSEETSGPEDSEASEDSETSEEAEESTEEAGESASGEAEEQSDEEAEDEQFY